MNDLIIAKLKVIAYAIENISDERSEDIVFILYEDIIPLIQKLK